MNDQPTPDVIKSWTRSPLITPGKIYQLALSRPEGDAPANCTDQSARVELMDGVMTLIVTGERSGHARLTLSVEARKALAAVLLDGVM